MIQFKFTKHKAPRTYLVLEYVPTSRTYMVCPFWFRFSHCWFLSVWTSHWSVNDLSHWLVTSMAWHCNFETLRIARSLNFQQTWSFRFGSTLSQISLAINSQPSWNYVVWITVVLFSQLLFISLSDTPMLGSRAVRHSRLSAQLEQEAHALFTNTVIPTDLRTLYEGCQFIFWPCLFWCLLFFVPLTPV